MAEEEAEMAEKGPEMAREEAEMAHNVESRLKEIARYLKPLASRLDRGAAFLLLVLLGACNDSTGPGGETEEGADLLRLFAPPTAGEMSTILAEWGGRNATAEEVSVLTEATLPYGSQGLRIQIVSHRVGEITHVGAVATPVGALPGSLPVLVYGHGGDQGENLDLTLLLLPVVLEDSVDDYVFVIPSFRSESLVFGGVAYESGGEPSPWDRDVDDALSLLEVALSLAPAADPERIGVLGFSRGANVGMIMALRDPRIDAVVEFFGPTDFFGSFVQGVVEDALAGTVRDLPGVPFLNESFIQPWQAGLITTDEVRLEMLRRSPVYFAGLLPDLQVHHGTADDVVPVGEAERLIEAMVVLGRDTPEFEAFLYEGGGHDPLSLPGSLPRTREFLMRLQEGSR